MPAAVNRANALGFTVTLPTVVEANVTVELAENTTLLPETHADPPVDEAGFDQLAPVQVAELLSVRQYCCAFKFAITPSTTANNPIHFPSLKTGEAIFQTRRRGRRFGILDVGCWMLE